MVFDYYPGCTLKTEARELDEAGRRSAAALGIELQELDAWQCCGAVYPLGRDEIAPRLSSVRALAAARDHRRDLLTLCSACHHVIKRVNHDIRTDEKIRDTANSYMEGEQAYQGETKVVHYLEMLRDTLGFDELKNRIKKPLTGMKIGAYYGCLLLRPGKVMSFDNPENPSIMESFITALGAEPVIYPYRNECCGGYITVKEKDQAARTASRVIDSALEHGADCLITACPLCLYNIDVNGTSSKDLPVYYITQLLAQALDV